MSFRKTERISGYTQYRGRTRPPLPRLPLGIIHNDANDANLLLGVFDRALEQLA